MHAPIRILLIEDDDVDAEVFRRSFQSIGVGADLHRARDGEEALRFLRDSGYDHDRIVVLDLSLPKVNGHELLRELRADDQLRRSVVFVLSSSDAPRDIEAAYDRQIAGYLVKETTTKQTAELLSRYWDRVQLPSKARA